MDRRERIDDLQTAVVAALMGWQAKLWTALPGAITAYNAGNNTCSVQPSLKVKQLAPDGSEAWVTMPLLVDCPVVFPGGGGFALTFPLVAGDECLVIFASRCIDAWWQSGGVQQQAEFRMHDLSDGFVIPGVRSVPSVPASISTTDVQLRSDDGAAFVSISPAHLVKVQTSGNVEVVGTDLVATLSGDADVTAAGSIEATAGTSIVLTAPTITLNGDTVINGTATVNGATSLNGPVSQVPGSQGAGASLFDGPLTVTNDVTATGTSLHTHTHNYVDNPSGTLVTSPPL